MKFRRFYFMTDFDWFCVFPTIILCKNEQIYMDKNFRFSIHWLGWHISWLWVAEKGAE